VQRSGEAPTFSVPALLDSTCLVLATRYARASPSEPTSDPNGSDFHVPNSAGTTVSVPSGTEVDGTVTAGSSLRTTASTHVSSMGSTQWQTSRSSQTRTAPENSTSSTDSSMALVPSYATPIALSAALLGTPAIAGLGRLGSGRSRERPESG
jgi:hypothetical protein